MTNSPIVPKPFIESEQPVQPSPSSSSPNSSTDKVSETAAPIIAAAASASSNHTFEASTRPIQQESTDPALIERFELAKIAAAQNAEQISQCIKEYNIQDQNMLFEIAKIAAANDGRSTSQYIQNYGIQDQNMLFEIAKIAAANDSMGTSEFIKRYGIKDQNMRFEIAKIAENGCTSNIAGYMKEYEFDNEDMIFEIAKTTAERSHNYVSYSIANYGLTDEDKIYKLVKIAVFNDPKGVARNIDGYKISSPERLFEIAKIVAELDAEAISKLIGNFHTLDIQQRFEVAKAATLNGGSTTLSKIANYNLNNEQIFEIAKLAAATEHGGISGTVPTHLLKDPNKIFEIAKIAAANNGPNTMEFIRVYELTDPAQLAEVLMIAIANGAKYSDLNNHLLKINHHLELFDYNEHELNQALEKYPAHLATIIRGIASEKNQFLKENQILWILPVLCFYELDESFRNDYDVFQDFLITLKNYHDPFLKKKMTQEFIQSFYCKDIPEGQKKAILGAFSTSKTTTKKLVPGRDRNNLSTFTEADGGTTTTVTTKVDEKKKITQTTKTSSVAAYKRIPTFFIGSAAQIPDSQKIQELVSKICCNVNEKNFIKTINAGLYVLSIDTSLDNEDKFMIINALANLGGRPENARQVLHALQLISAIISIGHAEKLKRSNLSDGASQAASSSTEVVNQHAFTTKQLEQILINLLTETLGKALESSWSQEKYLKTFSTFREPYAIFTYIGSINKLPEYHRIKAIEALTAYVIAVLNRTYKADRYDPETNIHLKTLFEGRDALRAEWIKGDKVEEADLIGASSSAASSGSSDMVESPAFSEQKNVKDNPLGDDDRIDIIDTDEAEDILLCGDEVLGSCQRLNGNPNLNKGLLGYLLNGQTRMVAVKDHGTGKILGRCLLRLLWDETHEKPALFQERCYFGNVADVNRIETLLDRMCSRRAAAMDCQLYKTDMHPKLTSLGGTAPFEYIDNQRIGIITDGKFTFEPYPYSQWQSTP